MEDYSRQTITQRGYFFHHITDPITRALTVTYLLSVSLTILKIVVIFPHFSNDVFRIVVFVVVSAAAILLCARAAKAPHLIRRYYHFGLMVYVVYLAISIFLLSKGINISTLQEFYLVIMWSFFGLGIHWGFLYAVVTIGMAVIFLVYSNQSITIIHLLPPHIPFWMAIFVIVTNFILAIFSLYTYQRAIAKTSEEKTALNKQLNKLLDAKTDFLSTMSHELRTPLNSVIGITNLLIDENRDESQNEDLKNLRFSAENLLLLINDILDFQKMDSHKLELESIPFNLVDLLEDACGSLKTKAAEKNLYFEVRSDSRLASFEVVGDPTRLTQIVFNLASNAIKFTEAGGAKVSCQLINEETDRATLRFSVEDTGIGITPDQQLVIFEPFIQASRNISRKFGGTGLGLSIVKHLVNLHGSAIQLDSVPNVGSTFYFDITYPKYHQRLASQTSVSTPSSRLITKESLHGLRVLLAEDNQMSVVFMRKLFAKWDVDPDIAKNGQEAIEKLTQQTYDVVLMDLHMPVMNGIEATQYIRSQEDPLKCRTYILALTASVSDDIIANIKSLGFDDYLGKPFRPNDLHHKLKKVLRNQIS
jgi:Signal transduction histidine kinase